MVSCVLIVVWYGFLLMRWSDRWFCMLVGVCCSLFSSRFRFFCVVLSWFSISMCSWLFLLILWGMSCGVVLIL